MTPNPMAAAANKMLIKFFFIFAPRYKFRFETLFGFILSHKRFRNKNRHNSLLCCDGFLSYERRTPGGRFGQRMKLVWLLRSDSGGVMPAALPASMHRSSQARLRPRLRMVCRPSASSATSPGVRPWATFQ